MSAALLLSLAVLLLHERPALAAITVSWSNFEHLEGVYFSPRIPSDRRRELLDVLEQAKARVRAFYGTLRGRPLLIMADAETLPRFTDNLVAVTHYQPTGAASVFGPAGQNVDVLAHELAHAEFFARVGYWTANWCIPVWLDEGLAVQFDKRPFYSDAALARYVSGGLRPPALAQLDERAEFFTGSREVVRFRYAYARSLVQRWLNALGGSALKRIDTLRCADEIEAEMMMETK